MPVLWWALSQHWCKYAARQAVRHRDASYAEVWWLRLRGHCAHWLLEVVWVIAMLLCRLGHLLFESFEESLAHLLHVGLCRIRPYNVLV